MDGYLLFQGRSATNPGMVTHQPKDGQPPEKCTKDFEFGTYTLLKKLTLGDNCHRWTPTIHRMIPHSPEDGHPPT